jgi:hypothetical protein
MIDPEYQRARRQAIKDGTWTGRSPKQPHAEYMRAYRASKRQTKPDSSEDSTPLLSEEELMRQVRARGKILRAMMRTPPALWKPEWLSDVQGVQQEADRV